MKIKKGDTVIVIAGRDKGVEGKVISVDTARQRVHVEGVNMVKRHTKVNQTPRGAKTGGIMNQESSIHVSNVMIIDEETKKPSRIGYRKEGHTGPSGNEKVRKVRLSKRSGKDI
jgi:large subunit ribosomal protein L24